MIAVAVAVKEVGIVVAAGLAAVVVLAPASRVRGAAMLGALVLIPVLLLSDIWNNSQVRAAARPAGAARPRAAAAALVAVGVAAWVFDRRPALLPLAAAAALPFRVPIESGGQTANLLVPLYLVVAAGALAFAVPRLRGRRPARRVAAAAARWSGCCSAPSRCTPCRRPTPTTSAKALEKRRLLLRPVRAAVRAAAVRCAGRVELARRCLGVLVALALVFSARRVRRVRDAHAAPQPEGHRLQPVRELLPGQLPVLRPQHLRALPRHRDACCWSAVLLWTRAPAGRRPLGRRAARAAVGRVWS